MLLQRHARGWKASTGRDCCYSLLMAEIAMARPSPAGLSLPSDPTSTGPQRSKGISRQSAAPWSRRMPDTWHWWKRHERQQTARRRGREDLGRAGNRRAATSGQLGCAPDRAVRNPGRCPPSSCAARRFCRSAAGSPVCCISTTDISRNSCRARAEPRAPGRRRRRRCSRRHEPVR